MTSRIYGWQAGDILANQSKQVRIREVLAPHPDQPSVDGDFIDGEIISQPLVDGSYPITSHVESWFGEFGYRKA